MTRDNSPTPSEGARVDLAARISVITNSGSAMAGLPDAVIEILREAATELARTDTSTETEVDLALIRARASDIYNITAGHVDGRLCKLATDILREISSPSARASQPSSATPARVIEPGSPAERLYETFQYALSDHGTYDDLVERLTKALEAYDPSVLDRSATGSSSPTAVGITTEDKGDPVDRGIGSARDNSATEAGTREDCALCHGEGAIRDKDGKLGEDCPYCTRADTPSEAGSPRPDTSEGQEQGKRGFTKEQLRRDTYAVCPTCKHMRPLDHECGEPHPPAPIEGQEQSRVKSTPMFKMLTEALPHSNVRESALRLSLALRDDPAIGSEELARDIQMVLSRLIDIATELRAARASLARTSEGGGARVQTLIEQLEREYDRADQGSVPGDSGKCDGLALAIELARAALAPSPEQTEEEG